MNISYLGWTMSLGPPTLTDWFDNNPLLHAAAADWLGLAVSVDGIAHADPSEAPALRHHIEVGRTGLEEQIIGTDAQIPLRWIEIDRIWRFLPVPYFTPKAIIHQRLNQAISTLRLTVRSLLMLQTQTIRVETKFDDPLQHNIDRLISSTKELLGHNPPKEVQSWVRAAITGILDQYTEAIPTDSATRLAAVLQPMPAASPT